MNILLWVLQVVIAIYCAMGASWRFLNYAQVADQIPSLKALSQGVWNLIGAFEIVCALGLIFPAVLGFKPILTPIAATCLAVEMLLLTIFHAQFFGMEMKPTNPAMWTLMLCALSAFVAYGRFALKPF